MLDFDRIAGKIFMGGAPDPNQNYLSLGFSMIAFCAREIQPLPDLFPNVSIIRIPLDDPPSFTAEAFASNWQKAMGGAAIIADRVSKGERVLITCAQGRNRSGVVAALTLWHLTQRPGWYCLEKVRQRRRTENGPALSNAGYAGALLTLPARKHAS